MMLSYPPLTMRPDGRVYLDPADDNNDPIHLGHVADPCPWPIVSEQWAWLAQEFSDSRRFALDCLAAADSLYLSHVGSPR